MQDDAKCILDRFQTTYKDCTENPAMLQVYEMLEYLVVENSHEVLGVCPQALQGILDLLRDKVVDVKSEYDDLETQKQQFQEIHVLKKYCEELQNDKERLQTFE